MTKPDRQAAVWMCQYLVSLSIGAKTYIYKHPANVLPLALEQEDDCLETVRGSDESNGNVWHC